MNDKEYEEYIKHKSAEFEKNINASFDYLKRNIEINDQIRKEKGNMLLYLHSRKPKLCQLKLFDDNYLKNIINIDYSIYKCSARTPSGLCEIK